MNNAKNNLRILNTISKHKRLFTAKFSLTHDKLIRIHETLLLNRLWAQKLSVSCAEWASIFVRCHKCKLRHHFYKKKLPWKMSPELAQNYEDEGKCKVKAFVVNIKQIRWGKLDFLFLFPLSFKLFFKSWKVTAVITIEHGNLE